MPGAHWDSFNGSSSSSNMKRAVVTLIRCTSSSSTTTITLSIHINHLQHYIAILSTTCIISICSVSGYANEVIGA